MGIKLHVFLTSAVEGGGGHFTHTKKFPFIRYMRSFVNPLSLFGHTGCEENAGIRTPVFYPVNSHFAKLLHLSKQPTKRLKVRYVPLFFQTVQSHTLVNIPYQVFNLHVIYTQAVMCL
jgi:hypothetical protein